MHKPNILAKLVRKFSKDASGNIALMVALLIIPLAAFIGGAIDYTQKVSFNSRLQTTLDSVSLAVAKAISRDKNITQIEMNLIAKRIYDANITPQTNVSTDKISVIRSKDILTVAQTGSLKTSFMSLVGVKSLNIQAKSLVNIKRSDVELVLILDMSGSMNDQAQSSEPDSKMMVLKSASRDLVNTLMPTTTGLSSMRIGFVPWNRGVNLGKYRKKILKNNNRGRKKCSSDRSGFYGDQSPASKKFNEADYCPEISILPLTKKKKKLQNHINTWQGEYGTSSDAGLAIGWGVISPKWNNIWPGHAKSKNYNAAKKFAVLMSDGENNNKSSNINSQTLCSAMKSAGITVYTIAFGTGLGADSIALLKNCASSNDRFINATSGPALKAAFQAIADEVGTFYISG